MENKEKLEIVGLDKKPKYWDDRYMDGIEKMTPRKYEVLKEEDVLMQVRDGVTLAVDIYRPDTDEDTKFPCLVAFSAYGKSIQTMDRISMQFKTVLFDHTIEAGDIYEYVRHGYIVVVPDPRGIGKSEGAWDGLYGRQEQEDCYDVIEWAATLPYCNGNIGMIGISYFSILQPVVAALQPPHLKAIMMVEVVDNMYHHNYPGGVFVNRSFMYTDFCPDVNSMSTAERTYTTEELKSRIEKRLSDPDINHSALYSGILSCWPPRNQTYFFDMLLHDDDSDFWRERSIQSHPEDIKVPMYLISEYYELGRFSQGPFFLFTHGDMSLPRKLAAPEEHDALHLPHRIMTPEYLRWYDYWLKGIDTGIMDEPPMKLLVRGINKFRYEYEWPLARTEWTKYYLRDGGLLSTEKEKDEHVEPTILNHKSPYEGGSNETYAVPNVVFRTPVLEEDVEVTGPIVMHLQCAIDKTDANFTIMLNDVPPEGEGRPMNLVTGNLRASHRGLEKKELKPWEFNNDHTRKVPVVPGEINEYTIEVMNTSNVFRKGHRIEVEVKNYDANPYHWMVQLPNSQDIEYKIFVDSIHASYIYLPIIPYSDEEQWLK